MANRSHRHPPPPDSGRACPPQQVRSRAPWSRRPYPHGNGWKTCRCTRCISHMSTKPSRGCSSRSTPSRWWCCGRLEGGDGGSERCGFATTLSPGPSARANGGKPRRDRIRSLTRAGMLGCARIMCMGAAESSPADLLRRRFLGEAQDAPPQGAADCVRSMGERRSEFRRSTPCCEMGMLDWTPAH